MKTNRLLSLSFFMLLAVVFTSCSSTIDIAKRQFNNGYYVRINNPKHHAENTLVSKKSEVNVVEESNSSVLAQKENVKVDVNEEIVSVQNVEVANEENTKPIATKKKSKEVIVLNDASTSADVEFVKQTRIQKRMNKIANRLPVMRDTPGIVLILLCLFIPPLAVGIADDWSNKFWIDILLCILFWIPGVIYAFWVCFFM